MNSSTALISRPKPNGVNAKGLASKTCKTCGRSFSWRKKWKAQWEDVKHCSLACRRHRLSRQDAALESFIDKALRNDPDPLPVSSLLAFYGRTPLGTLGQTDSGRLERIKNACRRMAHRHQLEMVKAGRVMDPDTAFGLFHIRRQPRA